MNIDKNLLWQKLKKFIDINYKTDSVDFENIYVNKSFLTTQQKIV